MPEAPHPSLIHSAVCQVLWSPVLSPGPGVSPQLSARRLLRQPDVCAGVSLQTRHAPRLSPACLVTFRVPLGGWAVAGLVLLPLHAQASRCWQMPPPLAQLAAPSPCRVGSRGEGERGRSHLGSEVLRLPAADLSLTHLERAPGRETPVVSRCPGRDVASLEPEQPGAVYGPLPTPILNHPLRSQQEPGRGDVSFRPNLGQQVSRVSHAARTQRWLLGSRN